MPPSVIQVPSIVLPTDWTLGAETIIDAAEHTSIEFPVEYLQEKTIHITATEVALAMVAVPNLQCWIELSPYPTVNHPVFWPAPLPISAAFWAAIGGGGGAIAPVAPLVEVSGLAGLPGNLTHGILLPWAIHSVFARVVVQAAAVVANTSWIVTVMISAKTP